MIKIGGYDKGVFTSESTNNVQVLYADRPGIFSGLKTENWKAHH